MRIGIVLKAELYDAETGRLLKRHRPGGGSSDGLLDTNLNVKPHKVRIKPLGSYRVQSGNDFLRPRTVLPAPAPEGVVLSAQPTRKFVAGGGKPDIELPTIRHISTTESAGGVNRHLFWAASPKQGLRALTGELQQRGFIVTKTDIRRRKTPNSMTLSAQAPDGTEHHFHVFRSFSGGPASAGFGEQFHGTGLEKAI